MSLLCNTCVASPVCPKQVNGGYISIGSECCKAVQKLAEALKPSHNTQSKQCQCTNSCVSTIYVCKDCGGRVNSKR